MSQFHIHDRLPTWRKIALSTWGRGDDPTIYGSVDIDAQPILNLVQKLRDSSGTRVTLTHVVGKAIALAFAKNPECNGVVSLGRLKLRDTVDVFFQVVFEGGKGLSGAKIERADEKSIVEIAQELEQLAKRVREKKNTELQKTQGLMSKLPGMLIAPALRLGEMLTYDFGLDLTNLGVPQDPFGSVMVTNVGVFGLERGWAPLLPIARTPALLTIGAVRDMVVVENGKPTVKPMLPIGATFDHRIIDGFHVGQLAKVLLSALADPEGTLT